MRNSRGLHRKTLPVFLIAGGGGHDFYLAGDALGQGRIGSHVPRQTQIAHAEIIRGLGSNAQDIGVEHGGFAGQSGQIGHGRRIFLRRHGKEQRGGIGQAEIILPIERVLGHRIQFGGSGAEIVAVDF